VKGVGSSIKKLAGSKSNIAWSMGREIKQEIVSCRNFFVFLRLETTFVSIQVGTSQKRIKGGNWLILSDLTDR
jgi:hypothetical protein